VASGTQPFSVTVDPTGKYVYVANSGDGTISQYTITQTGAAAGSLVPMSPAFITTGSASADPRFVAVSPNGKYAYAANYGNASVAQYTIVQTGANAGALTAMTPATVGSGNNPWVIAVDPTGKFAYSTNSTNASVEQYTIVQTGANAGALSQNPPPNDKVTTGATPQFVLVDAAGSHVYVANSGDGSLWQYNIAVDGTLTTLTPSNVFSGSQPWGFTIDATGKFAYAPNNGGGTLSQFSVNTDGTLHALTPSSVATGTGGATSGPTAVITFEP
jgi:6-phosphogluconolactonase (cycloisomerase 2 family)